MVDVDDAAGPHPDPDRDPLSGGTFIPAVLEGTGGASTSCGKCECEGPAVARARDRRLIVDLALGRGMPVGRPWMVIDGIGMLRSYVRSVCAVESDVMYRESRVIILCC